MAVPNTGIADIDKEKIGEYLEQIPQSLSGALVAEGRLYQNLSIMRGDRLTLGGLLFFAKDPQRYRSAFCIEAI